MAKDELRTILTIENNRGDRYYPRTWAEAREIFYYLVREGHEPSIYISKPRDLSVEEWQQLITTISPKFIFKIVINDNAFWDELPLRDYDFEGVEKTIDIVEKTLSAYVEEEVAEPPVYKFEKDCDNGDDVAVVTTKNWMKAPYEYQADLFITGVPEEVGEEELEELLEKIGYYNPEWYNVRVIKGLREMNRELRYQFHQKEAPFITYEELLERVKKTEEDYKEA